MFVLNDETRFVFSETDWVNFFVCSLPLSFSSSVVFLFEGDDHFSGGVHTPTPPETPVRLGSKPPDPIVFRVFSAK